MDKLEDPIYGDNKYLLDMLDCDGDRLTVASPWLDDDQLMMRIENDDTITGIIIDLPIALALLGILLPLIGSGKFKEKLKEYTDPDISGMI
jgi:hypothetical protein